MLTEQYIMSDSLPCIHAQLLSENRGTAERLPNVSVMFLYQTIQGKEYQMHWHLITPDISSREQNCEFTLETGNVIK